MRAHVRNTSCSSRNNKIIDNDNGLRIKTYVGATDASVTNVQYIGNTVTNAKKYGVVIEVLPLFFLFARTDSLNNIRGAARLHKRWRHR